MKKTLLILTILTLGTWAKPPFKLHEDERITAHIVDLKKDELNFYLKDDNGTIFKTFGNLNRWLATKNKKLLFAMNGGMYMENSMPLGLYVEKAKVIRKTNRVQHAYGNFYMQPNGVFFITKKKNAYIKPSHNFHFKSYVNYATQSGPMLVIKGKIHSMFKKGSLHVHIRNGVGVLPDGKLLFAISDELITFYDFAEFFQKNGCKNALYLDGAISKMYLPPKYDYFGYSRFGVIIGQVHSVK